MKEKNFVNLFLFVWWMGGFVVAHGWWKILAILLPPYAWYLFLEKILTSFKVI